MEVPVCYQLWCGSMGMLNLRRLLEHSVSSYKERRFLISNSGRFMNGSNSNLRYMPEALSSLAKKAGHPIVLVQINYRLASGSLLPQILLQSTSLEFPKTQCLTKP
jgi:hypothetical protein